jgi:4a-hydroxytetrahydrobiopterin dehydratase
MKPLTTDEVKDYLVIRLKNWTLEGSSIKREFKFRTFPEAFAFMTVVAFEAEKSDHHPDWSNVFNKVTINLSTHSLNGISQEDLDLAARIDAAYKNFKL